MRDCLFRSNSGRRDGFASVAVLIVFGLLFLPLRHAEVLSSEHLTARTRGTESAVAAVANAELIASIANSDISRTYEDALRFAVGSRLAATILVSSGDDRFHDASSAPSGAATKKIREEEIEASRRAGFHFVERSSFETKYLVMSDGSLAFYIPRGRFPSIGEIGRGNRFPSVHIGTDGWDYWQDVVREEGGRKP